jgi:hypothetical protein
MSLLVSDMGFLLDQNIVLGLAAVSGAGWITSRCSTILRFSSRKTSTLASPRASRRARLRVRRIFPCLQVPEYSRSPEPVSRCTFLPV